MALISTLVLVEVIPYRRFGTIYRPHLQGPTCCPETSARNFHYTPRNIPKESGSLLDSRSGTSISSIVR